MAPARRALGRTACTRAPALTSAFDGEHTSPGFGAAARQRTRGSGLRPAAVGAKPCCHKAAFYSPVPSHCDHNRTYATKVRILWWQRQLCQCMLRSRRTFLISRAPRSFPQIPKDVQFSGLSMSSTLFCHASSSSGGKQPFSTKLGGGMTCRREHTLRIQTPILQRSCIDSTPISLRVAPLTTAPHRPGHSSHVQGPQAPAFVTDAKNPLGTAHLLGRLMLALRRLVRNVPLPGCSLSGSRLLPPAATLCTRPLPLAHGKGGARTGLRPAGRAGVFRAEARFRSGQPQPRRRGPLGGGNAPWGCPGGGGGGRSAKVAGK